MEARGDVESVCNLGEPVQEGERAEEDHAAVAEYDGITGFDTVEVCSCGAQAAGEDLRQSDETMARARSESRLVDMAGAHPTSSRGEGDQERH
jgi:hypothetical protein